MSTLPDYIMDVTQKEVDRIMLKYHVTRLIHGHTHREAIHEWVINDKSMTRIVLGAWHEHGNVLVCESNGDVYLKNIK
jgi:UDP-2,3-diacylglucosamine hydrolase